jgi:hypothetical protein
MQFLFQYRVLHRAEHLLPGSVTVTFCGSQENSATVQPSVPETYEPLKQKGKKRKTQRNKIPIRSGLLSLLTTRFLMQTCSTNTALKQQYIYIHICTYKCFFSQECGRSQHKLVARNKYLVPDPPNCSSLQKHVADN